MHNYRVGVPTRFCDVSKGGDFCARQAVGLEQPFHKGDCFIYSQIAFRLSLFCVGLIVTLSVAPQFTKGAPFWPPPSKNSWQHKAFIVLFRGFLYPLIALTVLQFERPSGANEITHFGLGSLLLITGFGLAFWITFKLGWRNAFGEELGLRTTGWFGWSRNPIYVVTWVGLLGWGLIANSVLVSILLSIWALLYVIAPYLEEPWLEEHYGDAYRAYKDKTPRFI